MRLHLPSSGHPSDEFQLPDGTWLPVHRTIVYDSWLLWRHALPRRRSERAELRAEHVERITALAVLLDRLHRQTPGYANLEDTPVRVKRWFDPTGGDPLFASGGQALLAIEGQDPRLLLQLWPLAAGTACFAGDGERDWIRFTLADLIPQGS